MQILMSSKPIFPADKRWERRRERWLPPGETIRPSEFGVDVVPERSARALVLEHHYSGGFPAARLSVGFFRKTGVAPARLVGVAVFSVPMQGAAITRYSGFARLASSWAASSAPRRSFTTARPSSCAGRWRCCAGRNPRFGRW